MHDLFKYLYYKLTPGKKRWYPMLSVYYLTYRCRFRCPYCSDGSGRPYYEIDSPDPPGDTALAVLKRIRSYCRSVVITGGEPLEHPELEQVLTGVPKLKFAEVVFTTNGFDLERYLPSITDSVDTLVFSLDTLDPGKADAWNGVGPGSLDKILANIRLAKDAGKGKLGIFISSVVTPENIGDLYPVYEYARQHGFAFAAAPQLRGVKAAEELTGNDGYRRFYDFLVTEKEKGGQVFGPPLYLQYMRDLKDFSCSPFTMLVVAPTGEVFYPCLEIGHHAGNILEDKSLHEFRRMGEEQFGPQPQCGNQCHSACALGFSLLLKNPLAYIEER